LGSLIVTYRFHPLVGRELVVLFSKRFGGRRLFVCEAGGGRTVTVPEQWTDRWVPAEDRRLSQEALIELRALVNALVSRCADGDGAR
jgi:hypothetical protein